MMKDIANGKHYNAYVISEGDVGRCIVAKGMLDKAGVNPKGEGIIRRFPGLEFDIPAGMIGLPLSPYGIDFISPESISAIDFTIIKKAWRLGLGGKTEDQDLLDIIGACKQGKLFHPNRAWFYDEVSALCRFYIDALIEVILHLDADDELFGKELWPMTLQRKYGLSFVRADSLLKSLEALGYVATTEDCPMYVWSIER